MIEENPRRKTKPWNKDAARSQPPGRAARIQSSPGGARTRPGSSVLVLSATAVLKDPSASR